MNILVQLFKVELLLSEKYKFFESINIRLFIDYLLWIYKNNYYHSNKSFTILCFTDCNILSEYFTSQIEYAMIYKMVYTFYRPKDTRDRPEDTRDSHIYIKMYLDVFTVS